MSDDDIAQMILVRSTENHTDDSVLIDADCGCKCWISQSGKTMLDNPPHEIVTTCGPCSGMNSMEMVLAGLRGQVGAIPGQYQKMCEALGEDATNMLFDLFSLPRE